MPSDSTDHYGGYVLLRRSCRNEARDRYPPAATALLMPEDAKAPRKADALRSRLVKPSGPGPFSTA